MSPERPQRISSGLVTVYFAHDGSQIVEVQDEEVKECISDLIPAGTENWHLSYALHRLERGEPRQKFCHASEIVDAQLGLQVRKWVADIPQAEWGLPQLMSILMLAHGAEARLKQNNNTYNTHLDEVRLENDERVSLVFVRTDPKMDCEYSIHVKDLLNLRARGVTLNLEPLDKPNPVFHKCGIHITGTLITDVSQTTTS